MQNNNHTHKPSGICYTCNYARSCIYLTRSKSSIWYCDEFKSTDLEHHIEITHMESNTNPKSNNNLNANLPKGICCNCENLSSCQFQKHQDVIWHCEEYN